jgi:hypothetical protein
MTTLKKRDIFLGVMQTLIALGVLSTAVQVGEYKERFANLQSTISQLSRMIDVNAAENKNEHDKIKNAFIDYTGKPIR